MKSDRQRNGTNGTSNPRNCGIHVTLTDTAQNPNSTGPQGAAVFNNERICAAAGRVFARLRHSQPRWDPVLVSSLLFFLSSFLALLPRLVFLLSFRGLTEAAAAGEALLAQFEGSFDDAANYFMELDEATQTMYKLTDNLEGASLAVAAGVWRIGARCAAVEHRRGWRLGGLAQRQQRPGGRPHEHREDDIREEEVGGAARVWPERGRGRHRQLRMPCDLRRRLGASWTVGQLR